MKKRLLSVVLAISTIMSLAACGNSNTSGSTSEVVSQSAASDVQNGSGEVKHLTLWTIVKNDAATKVINDAAANFKETNNVEVEVQFFENDPYKTKLKTVMGSGEAPDIFHSWGGAWLRQFVDEDQVLEITDKTANFKS